jgi:Fusaric acid resistance protein-like
MRTTFRRRLVAVRPSLWPIAQTAVAAGVAWELARQVADHPRPIFAPIVAIVAMGITAGRRARAALLMVLGVALGILIADVLTRAVGHGGWQIVVVVAIAMTVAAVIRAEPLFVSQAAVSGMLVVVLPAASGGRLVDCAIGGAVAFVASALLFPLDTERVLLRETQRVSGGIAASLEESAAALQHGDPERAWRGRHRVVSAAALDEALVVAHGAVRVAPRRFASRGSVEAYERAISHLAAASRATRVLGGTVARLLRAGGTASDGVGQALRLLAEAARDAPAAIDGSTDAAHRLDARTAEATEAARRVAPAAGDVAGAALVHLVETIADRLSSAASQGANAA